MAPPFWPWTQVLRELGHATNPLSEARLPADADQAMSDGTVDRFALFDAVGTLLIEVAEAHGLVVVLDDLHWADEATLALLSFLSRHVPRSRVLIVGGFRDVDASTPLVRLTGSVEVVTLAGLADEEAADLADAVAAGRLATDGVADVVRRAGGNPLFVRELTRLVAAGRSSGGEPVHVPGGVREVVAQRLARLSPACRAMLDVAAVAGAEVRLDVLARTLSGHDDLPDLVAEAVRARILVTPLDELAPLGFAHDLFREVLSAMLSPAIKAQLHLTLARTLDQLRADGVPIAHASVAAHYVGAASLGLRPAALEAVRHSQQAALDAAGQLAFEDAAGHLRRALAALQLADHPAAGVRLDLLLSLGVALDHAGDATGAREVLVEAADLARQLGDAGGFARAAIGTHRLGALSGLSRDHNVRLLEEASSSLAGQSSPLRARVLASLARELHHTWDPGTDDRAREIALEAVDVARSLDDPSTLAYCLLALHDTSWSVGSAGERLPIVAEMLDLARLAGDRELHAQAQLLKATALLELGDPAAPAELERYCRAAEDLGHARGRWGALSRRAVLAAPGRPARRGRNARSCRRPARRGDRRTRHAGRARHPPVGAGPLPRRLVRLRHRRTLGPARHLAPDPRRPAHRPRGPRGGPGGAGRLLPRTGSPPRRAPPRRLDARDHHRSRRLGRQRGPAEGGLRLAAPAGRPPPRLRRLHGLRRRRRPPPRHTRRGARPP